MPALLRVLLYNVFGGLLSVSLKKILVGAGLGLVTGAISLSVINYYIDKVKDQFGVIGDMAVILRLGGFDVALSIIAGAIVVKAMIAATKVSLSAVKK